MTHSTYPIADFPGFRNGGADGEDRAGEVAAEEGGGGREVVEVFPVGGVEGDGVGFNEEVGIAETGVGARGGEVGGARGGDDEGFLGWGGHFLGGR